MRVKPKFAVGDNVRHKTTGQAMLVDDVQPCLDNYRYRCLWMDTDGKQRFSDHGTDELELWTRDPGRDDGGGRD